MTKREYDFAFSLGFACPGTQALRAAGCQFASYPLDWVGSPDLMTSVEAVCTDFAHWLDREDLRLVDVSHDAGFCTRIYQNDRTGFGFSHEFSDFQRFDESYPKVKASYDHRIVRFLETLRTSKRILAIYLEQAHRPGLASEAVVEAVGRLRRRCAPSSVDVLYFYEDPSCPEPKVVSESDGVTIIAADYRKIEDGRATQYMKVEMIAGFLSARVRVLDRRTAEARQKFAADCRTVGTGRWGYDKSAFRRWLNQRAYKLYRHLERHLRRKGLIHPKRPVWFWDERWQRKSGRSA